MDPLRTTYTDLCPFVVQAPARPFTIPVKCCVWIHVQHMDTMRFLNGRDRTS